MEALDEAFDAVERRRRTLEVHADDDAVAAELERQFATRNVRVSRRPAIPAADPGYVIVRDAEGAFRGALGVEHFRALLSPEIHPPWVLAESEGDRGEYAEIFDFLDNTLFSAYDRRGMLATSREIEERAWRVADGGLYVGFQNAAALDAQTPVYDRLARRGTLRIRAYVVDEWDAALAEGIEVVSDSTEEIGRFWFVVFDGAGSDLNKCALLAEERDPGRYYGFWTYDPGFVDELVEYLRSTYGEG